MVTSANLSEWLAQIKHAFFIDAPFPQMIMSGTKTVETQHYPLDKRYEGVTLAMIDKVAPQQEGSGRGGGSGH